MLDASSELFLEKSYEQVTLSEIAKKAKVGKGNIYTYFDRKEDILFTLMADSFTEGITAVEEVISKGVMNSKEDFLNILQDLISAFLPYIERIVKFTEQIAYLDDNVKPNKTYKGKSLQNLKDLITIMGNFCETGSKFCPVKNKKITSAQMGAIIIDIIGTNFRLAAIGEKTMSNEAIFLVVKRLFTP
ncbi:MAG: TetR/AcrR family transcriptional regulator [Candidatus Riflebacteria bacterium]|nr:TetR/AcrR family transcriptional regulator [Candidatus Riflebacteria bacterium]